MPPKRGGWQEYKGNQPPTQQQTNNQEPKATNQPQVRKVSEEETKGSSEQKQAFEYKEHKTLSNLKLVAHCNKGPAIYNLNVNGSEIETLVKEEGYPEYPGAELAKFSPINGKTLAVVNFKGINLVDIESKKEVLHIPKKGVIALDWSPLENFVISCEKYKEGQKNLSVWDAKTGNLVLDFEWKNTAKDGPNSVKFDPEEKYCAR